MSEARKFITEGLVRIYDEGALTGAIANDKASRLNEGEGGAASSSGSSGAAPSGGTLFYNPAQVFNRDLSLIVIKTFAERVIEESFEKFRSVPVKRHVPEIVKGVTICEPLGATGLRSLRYVKELPQSYCRRAFCGDIDPNAVANQRLNRELNEIEEARFVSVTADAADLLHAGKYICGTGHWDVVDLDPYGSVAPFIDGGVRAVKNGGLLCVTSTDMPVLGGKTPDVAFYKYGGNTVKAGYLHEMSLRLVIHSLQMAAGRYRRFVKPLLSVSADFYVRIFVQISDKPLLCSHVATQTAVVHQCSQCDWFVTVPFGKTHSKTSAGPSAHNPTHKRRRVGRPDDPAAPADTASADTAPGEASTIETTASTCASTEPSQQDGTEDGAASAKMGAGSGGKVELPKVVTYQISDAPGVRHAVGTLPDEAAGHRCPVCSSSVTVGGPFYAGPLQDPEFLAAVLRNAASATAADNALLVEEAPEQPTAEETSKLFSPETAAEIDRGYVGDPIPKKDERPSLEELEGKFDWVEKARLRFLHDKGHHRMEGLSKTVAPKIKGTLMAMQDEIGDVPLYYRLPSLCNDAHIGVIKQDKFRSALLNMGYRVGLFHREPMSIKTDAPSFVVFDILRQWVQSEIKKEMLLKPTTPAEEGAAPVKQDTTTGSIDGANLPRKFNRVPPRYLSLLDSRTPAIDFSYHPSLKKGGPAGGAGSPRRNTGPRWVANPTSNWGPGRRAKRHAENS